VAVAAVISPLPALWNSIELPDLITTSNYTGHRAFNIATARFKLDFIEGNSKATRTDLFGIPSIIEVDISKAEIVRFVSNGPATRANGTTLHLTVRLAIAVIAIVSIMTVRSVTTIIIANMKSSISRLYGNAASNAFAGLAMIRQSWRCEEQRRRKGKRGCSRLHDTIYHGCRKSHAIST